VAANHDGPRWERSSCGCYLARIISHWMSPVVATSSLDFKL